MFPSKKLGVVSIASLTLVLAGTAVASGATNGHVKVHHSAVHKATKKTNRSQHRDTTVDPGNSGATPPSGHWGHTPPPPPTVTTVTNTDGSFTSTITGQRGVLASVTFTDANAVIANVVVTPDTNSPFSASSPVISSAGATFTLTSARMPVRTLNVTIVDNSGTPEVTAQPQPPADRGQRPGRPITVTTDNHDGTFTTTVSVKGGIIASLAYSVDTQTGAISNIVTTVENNAPITAGDPTTSANGRSEVVLTNSMLHRQLAVVLSYRDGAMDVRVHPVGDPRHHGGPASGPHGDGNSAGPAGASGSTGGFAPSGTLSSGPQVQ